MDERFIRNEMLWGPAAQARLTRAHVLVLGLGGVGSYVVECLARAGIGELTDRPPPGDSADYGSGNRQQAGSRPVAPG